MPTLPKSNRSPSQQDGMVAQVRTSTPLWCCMAQQSLSSCSAFKSKYCPCSEAVNLTTQDRSSKYKNNASFKPIVKKLKTALINGKLIQSKVIYKIYKVKLLFKTKIENRMQQLRGICMKKTLKSFLNNGLHALLFSGLICISPAKASNCSENWRCQQRRCSRSCRI